MGPRLRGDDTVEMVGAGRAAAGSPIAALLKLTLALTLATPALAAEGRRNTPPPRTEIHLAVFGNDPCPKGVGDEIVVCARLPESERFRIPKRLRDEAKQKRPEQSWVSRVRDIEETGRDGRPNSCSAVGSNGQTGCWQKFMHDARVQKEADAAAASDVP